MPDQSPTALGVVLGYHCNFFCDHCINDSGPQRTLALSEDEIANIIADFKRLKMNEIAYTGGEPYFYKETIKTINKACADQLEHVQITTNASFATSVSRAEEVIAELSLTRLRVSCDRHHLKYGKLSRIKNSFAASQNKGINFLLELSFTSPEDLLLLSKLGPLRDYVSLNPILPVGRAKKTGCAIKYPHPQPENLKRKCPAIESKVLIYMPQKGYTFCCSSLAFSNEVADRAKYSPTIEGVYKNPIYRELSALENMAALKTTNQSNESEVCTLCTDHYASAPFKKHTFAALQKEFSSSTHGSAPAGKTPSAPCNCALFEATPASGCAKKSGTLF